MSTYNINLPAATSFGITNIYNPPTSNQNDTPNDVTVNIANPDNGFSFVQNVLQTLQEVTTANQDATAPTDTTTTSNPIQALQVFLYDLNQALTTNSSTTTDAATTTPSEIKIAYSNPASNLQNLIGSLDNGSDQSNTLQADFSTLVQSIGGSPSSTNLQDFLQKLSTNLNGDLTNLGNLFAATA